MKSGSREETKQDWKVDQVKEEPRHQPRRFGSSEKRSEVLLVGRGRVGGSPWEVKPRRYGRALRRQDLETITAYCRLEVTLEAEKAPARLLGAAKIRHRGT